MFMQSTEPSDQAAQKRAFRTNRIAAIVMTLAIAAGLLVQRPEVAPVYLGYVIISVYFLALAKTYGVLVKSSPLSEQNFAAYVSVATLGFFAVLIGAPHLIDLYGTMVLAVLSMLMAIFLARAIIKSL
jgi:asparagine N-glycosylation enzyme membrane subunit Stt3